MSSNLFTYRDDVEGKVGIGKLPSDLLPILNNISSEYYNIIPDKNVSTYHTWYDDMPYSIKHNVEQIQKSIFWNKLCDGSKKCIKISANEIDELYYSNPKNDLKKTNLYGESNYYIHKDCIFKFNGINFYRIIIGLSHDNDNVITHFNNLGVGHKINYGDFVVFDFDKSTHQVITEKLEAKPRLLLKIHYIVCENCKYDKEYIEKIKLFYLYYEYITRNVMNFGTEPKGFPNFFVGLLIQYFFTPNIQFILLFIIVIIIIIFKYLFNIKLIYKNVWKLTKYVAGSIIIIYLTLVIFYWLRYKLYGIR